jgi:hypothetical protein
VTRYAEGTKVEVQSSRGEITGILAKHGVERMGWTSEPTGDSLVFELHGGTYRLTMTKPTAEGLRARDGGTYSYPHNIDWEAKATQEWRRVWRANVLLLKAKLEFIDSGDTTIDRELLPYRVLKGGQTIEEVLVAGGLPLLTAGGR